MDDKNKAEEIIRKQIWDYFQLHSSQRLTTFNFYLIISSLLASALFSTFQQDFKVPFLSLPMGLALSFLSFVFWRIDERNRILIRTAEDALKYYEQQYTLGETLHEPHAIQIFLRDEFLSNIKRTNTWIYSYAECFRAIFMSFGLLGIIAALTALRGL